MVVVSEELPFAVVALVSGRRDTYVRVAEVRSHRLYKPDNLLLLGESAGVAWSGDLRPVGQPAPSTSSR